MDPIDPDRLAIVGLDPIDPSQGCQTQQIMGLEPVDHCVPVTPRTPERYYRWKLNSRIPSEAMPAPAPVAVSAAAAVDVASPSTPVNPASEAVAVKPPVAALASYAKSRRLQAWADS